MVSWGSKVGTLPPHWDLLPWVGLGTLCGPALSELSLHPYTMNIMELFFPLQYPDCLLWSLIKKKISCVGKRNATKRPGWYPGDGCSKSCFSMINMTDCSNVHMWLPAISIQQSEPFSATQWILCSWVIGTNMHFPWDGSERLNKTAREI